MTPVTDPLSAITPPVRIDDRVTVRRRLSDGSAADLVGWITDLDAEQIGIQLPDPNGQAPTITVRREQIILARRVPPARGGRPPARVGADEVELIAMGGWLDSTRPLGNWTLRLGNGFTGRANSCLAVGDPGLFYEQAAAAIIDCYQSAGLPPWAQVVVDSEPDRRLRDLGWRPTYVRTTVLTHTLNGLLTGHPRDGRVHLTSELTEAWWQGYLRYRSVDDHATARRILTNNPPVGLAGIHDADPNGPLIALGRGQISQEWLGITGLWTDPDHRRTGLATTIIRQLAHWAARRGARNAYLQVAADNVNALAAYRTLGFTEHHDYRYLTPDER